MYFIYHYLCFLYAEESSYTSIYVLLVFSMFNSQRLAEAHEVLGSYMIYMADFSDYSAEISAMQRSLFQVCHNKFGWFLNKIFKSSKTSGLKHGKNNDCQGD